MQDEVLIQLAHELTETVRKNRTVDWDKKESARAFMRREIKRLLRKYHYPPTKADEAVQTVVLQAELMGDNIEVSKNNEEQMDKDIIIPFPKNREQLYNQSNDSYLLNVAEEETKVMIHLKKIRVNLKLNLEEIFITMVKSLEIQ